MLGREVGLSPPCLPAWAGTNTQAATWPRKGRQALGGGLSQWLSLTGRGSTGRQEGERHGMAAWPCLDGRWRLPAGQAGLDLCH